MAVRATTLASMAAVGLLAFLLALRLDAPAAPGRGAPPPKTDLSTSIQQPLAAAPEAAPDPAPVREPGVDTAPLRELLDPGRWPDAAPAWEGSRCDPAPCVSSLSFRPDSEEAADFQREFLRELYALGRGVGQPSIVQGEPAGGRQRVWVFWVPDGLAPEEAEALAAQARAHVRADGGPDLR